MAILALSAAQRRPHCRPARIDELLDLEAPKLERRLRLDATVGQEYDTPNSLSVKSQGPFSTRATPPLPGSWRKRWFIRGGMGHVKAPALRPGSGAAHPQT